VPGGANACEAAAEDEDPPWVRAHGSIEIRAKATAPPEASGAGSCGFSDEVKPKLGPVAAIEAIAVPIR
jgi:hypothetical protein